MANEAFGKFHDRNGFFDISIIFVPVVMEGNKVTVVFINPESGDHGTPKITSDVLVGSITDSSLALQAAGELLNHIFARRDMEPATIPVEILE